MTIIKRVGPEYNKNREKGERDFERAENNVSELEKAMSQLEITLKKVTGYNKFNLPYESDEKRITLPDCPVLFSIRSEYRTTKKPSYKTAAEDMERHLNGIIFHLSRGRTITGIAKENDVLYIGVEKLKEDFDIIVGGILEGGLEQTIKYKTDDYLKKEESLKEIEIPINPSAKTKENFIFYAKADKIKSDENKYIKAYKADYAAELKRKGEIKEQVSSTRTVVAKKSIIKAVNWGAVVKTLVTVPVSDAPTGEFDEILELYKSKGLNSVQNKFRWYDLIERETRNKKTLYVSICSVSEVIQNLKQDIPQIKSRRYDIKSRPA